jgi:hypothetical protein
MCGAPGEIHQAEKRSQEIFYNQFFIHEDLNKLDMRNRWIGAIQEYKENKDSDKFAIPFGTIVAEIRLIAKPFVS